MTPKTPKSICPCEMTRALVRPETPKTIAVIWLLSKIKIMETYFRGFAGFILIPLILGLAIVSIIFYILVLVAPSILLTLLLEDVKWFNNSKIGKTLEDEDFFLYFSIAFGVVFGWYLYNKFNFKWRTLNDLVYEFLNNIFSLSQILFF